MKLISVSGTDGAGKTTLINNIINSNAKVNMVIKFRVFYGPGCNFIKRIGSLFYNDRLQKEANNSRKKYFRRRFNKVFWPVAYFECLLFWAILPFLCKWRSGFIILDRGPLDAAIDLRCFFSPRSMIYRLGYCIMMFIHKNCIDRSIVLVARPETSEFRQALSNDPFPVAKDAIEGWNTELMRVVRRFLGSRAILKLETDDVDQMQVLGMVLGFLERSPD